MAWDSDIGPLEYLERRVKYYERLHRRIPLWYRKKQLLHDRYTEKDVLERCQEIQNRIDQYKIAIDILNLYVEK